MAGVARARLTGAGAETCARVLARQPGSLRQIQLQSLPTAARQVPRIALPIAGSVASSFAPLPEAAKSQHKTAHGDRNR